MFKKHYHHAKFNIYHIYSVPENPNVTSFCHIWMASLTLIIRLAFFCQSKKITLSAYTEEPSLTFWPMTFCHHQENGQFSMNMKPNKERNNKRKRSVKFYVLCFI